MRDDFRGMSLETPAAGFVLLTTAEASASAKPTNSAGAASDSPSPLANNDSSGQKIDPVNSNADRSASESASRSSSGSPSAEV